MNGWGTFIYYLITIMSHLSLRGQRERKKINTQIKAFGMFIAAVIIFVACCLDNGKLAGAEFVALIVFLMGLLTATILFQESKCSTGGFHFKVGPSGIEFSRDTEGKLMKPKPADPITSLDLKR